MKIRLAMLSLLVLSVLLPAYNALACEATVSSLRTCVQMPGHVTSSGVLSSLLAKLDAAQAAVEREQPRVAINQLRAFIHEVNAQTGKGVDPMHGQHIADHAQMVIDALL